MKLASELEINSAPTGITAAAGEINEHILAMAAPVKYKGGPVQIRVLIEMEQS